MLSKALLDTQEEEKRERFNSRSQELVKHEERLTWKLPDLLVLVSRSLDSSCLWRWILVRNICFRCDVSQQEAHSCAIGVIFPNYIPRAIRLGKQRQPWRTFPVTPGNTTDDGDGDVGELISGMTHHNCTAFISISLLFYTNLNEENWRVPPNWGFSSCLPPGFRGSLFKRTNK